VDFDPELWQTGVRETSREADDLEWLKQTYRLQHIRDSFYRIVERLPRQTDDDAAQKSIPSPTPQRAMACVKPHRVIAFAGNNLFAAGRESY